jgi:hydrogenase small subunit
VKKRGSLWDLFQEKKLSRRDFLRTCVAVTGMLGLSPTLYPQVVEALEKKTLPPVIFLHGHECTGCVEAMTRSDSPLTSDLLLNMISLEVSETLSAASGDALEHHAEEIMQQYAGKYILIFEGAVPLAQGGIHCTINGVPVVDILKKYAKNAAAVIELGSCATWGGIQAAKPNPTESVSVSEVLRGSKPIVKIPGCPPIPEVITSTVMHYVVFGQLPPLDKERRPKQFFGNRIHDTCYRRAFFDSGMFVERFDDPGSKAGWCLYKVGCRGPVAYNSCGNLRWWNGLSYPIQSGAPCIACASNNFWDQDPFFERLPNIPVANTIANADRIGMWAVGAATAGVAAHAAVSAVQKHRRDRDTENEKHDDHETE